MEYRKEIVAWLFKNSQKLYGNLFLRRKPWDIKKEDLLNYPTDSFGKHLGLFLAKHNFELIPKGERHDAYHTLTGYKTEVEDEIALQYLCIGNGKKSLYAIGAAIFGSIILPEYYKFYYASFWIGKNANVFHHFDYRLLLHVSLQDLRASIFSKTQIKSINLLYKTL
jgi:ubiquinone biosynthesis protein Coq4